MVDKDRFCILVRIVFCLGVRGELRVLKVLIIVNVFLQMYMDFLEMKDVLMIGGSLSEQTLVLLEIPGIVGVCCVGC